jgi:hypothetical protein
MNVITVSKTPLHNYVTGSQTLYFVTLFTNTKVATSSSNSHGSFEVGVTRAACKLVDTHECSRHTQHDHTALRRRLRPLASSSGRRNRLAQWGGKEREHAPEFPATLLDRPVAARSRAKSTCGAQETIYKQEMQIQVAHDKRRPREETKLLNKRRN